MLKVMTIVGTRPEIIKLSEVIKELDKNTNHTLVHTGQNYDYELNNIFFEQLLDKRKPDYFLESSKNSVAETIGDVISKIDPILDKVKPDAVLIYGDTNSCLSIISAKRRKIPIFHMEAGNRCFDSRVPEELNRKVVDHLSDINLPLSNEAKQYLIREGIKPETIIKIGSPMMEVLQKNLDKIKNSEILKKEKLESKKYFVLSIHREENVESEKNFKNIINSIREIKNKYGIPLIVSTHPRMRKKIEQESISIEDSLIKLSKPLGFFEYCKLQTEALCVISDSGTITEETTILNLASVNLRENHERPEGMDETSTILTGMDTSHILRSIDLAIDHHKEDRSFKLIKDYNVDNVSKKIIRIIYSYYHYVNSYVWYKN
ncbi:UDP-N-acetylglucosamine 2-epimerase (non-hydrolyzing) [Pelagibacteraceae bacterium]|nr:UDP-N-acetylglucosamine 2-epimerase (non-hydrolyzing) [Pelagibacteraceae bacterium]